MSQLAEQASVLRITTAGSVDDGKSTLIGRLLFEAKAILDDQLEALQKARLIDGGIDLSLVTDGLKSEREQGITIDVAYKYFSSPKRKFILADAPGHVQYTRNMVTAASRADAAIILVDARHGILEQTRRHAYLVHLLQVPHVILAINKIDAIDYDQGRIVAIEQEFRRLEWNQEARSLHVVPLSALRGDNVSTRSERTHWYSGPSLLEILETLPSHSPQDTQAELPVQIILRDSHGQRYAAGTLTAGSYQVGDAVRILPSRQESTIASILVQGKSTQKAVASEAIAIALADERDLERGSLIVPVNTIAAPSQDLRAHLVWFDNDPFRPQERYIIRLGTQTARAQIKAIAYRFNLETLRPENVSELHMNDIALVDVHSSRSLYQKPFRQHKRAGAFVLIDPRSYRTVAAGMIESSLGDSDHEDLQGRLVLVDHLTAADQLEHDRILQFPAIALKTSRLRSLQQSLELLLESGWSLHLEKSPESEFLAKALSRRGIQTFEHGLGI
jgi:sulfate adenylyltransferase large subunit